MADPKSNWPECVGMTGPEAEAHIKAERPELNVQVVNELSPCTMDLRTDRVRVFINKEGKVVGAPDGPRCG